jgi:hypothetical protein
MSPLLISFILFPFTSFRLIYRIEKVDHDKFNSLQTFFSSQPNFDADSVERKEKNAETLIDEINLCEISRMSIDFLVSN